MVSYKPGKGQLIKRVNNQKNSKKTNQAFQLHKMNDLHVGPFSVRQLGGTAIQFFLRTAKIAVSD
jgi:hypothetical protein